MQASHGNSFGARLKPEAVATLYRTEKQLLAWRGPSPRLELYLGYRFYTMGVLCRSCRTQQIFYVPYPRSAIRNRVHTRYDAFEPAKFGNAARAGPLYILNRASIKPLIRESTPTPTRPYVMLTQGATFKSEGAG